MFEGSPHHKRTFLAHAVGVAMASMSLSTAQAEVDLNVVMAENQQMILQMFDELSAKVDALKNSAVSRAELNQLQSQNQNFVWPSQAPQETFEDTAAAQSLSDQFGYAGASTQATGTSTAAPAAAPSSAELTALKQQLSALESRLNSMGSTAGLSSTAKAQLERQKSQLQSLETEVNSLSSLTSDLRNLRTLPEEVGKLRGLPAEVDGLKTSVTDLTIDAEDSALARAEIEQKFTNQISKFVDQENLNSTWLQRMKLLLFAISFLLALIGLSALLMALGQRRKVAALKKRLDEVSETKLGGADARVNDSTLQARVDSMIQQRLSALGAAGAAVGGMALAGSGQDQPSQDSDQDLNSLFESEDEQHSNQDTANLFDAEPEEASSQDSVEAEPEASHGLSFQEADLEHESQAAQDNTNQTQTTLSYTNAKLKPVAVPSDNDLSSLLEDNTEDNSYKLVDFEAESKAQDNSDPTDSGFEFVSDDEIQSSDSESQSGLDSLTQPDSETEADSAEDGISVGQFNQAFGSEPEPETTQAQDETNVFSLEELVEGAQVESDQTLANTTSTDLALISELERETKSTRARRELEASMFTEDTDSDFSEPQAFEWTASAQSKQAELEAAKNELGASEHSSSDSSEANTLEPDFFAAQTQDATDQAHLTEADTQNTELPAQIEASEPSVPAQTKEVLSTNPDQDTQPTKLDATPAAAPTAATAAKSTLQIKRPERKAAQQEAKTTHASIEDATRLKERGDILGAVEAYSAVIKSGKLGAHSESELAKAYSKRAGLELGRGELQAALADYNQLIKDFSNSQDPAVIKLVDQALKDSTLEELTRTQTISASRVAQGKAFYREDTAGRSYMEAMDLVRAAQRRDVSMDVEALKEVYGQTPALQFEALGHWAHTLRERSKNNVLKALEQLSSGTKAGS